RPCQLFHGIFPLRPRAQRTSRKSHRRPQIRPRRSPGRRRSLTSSPHRLALYAILSLVGAALRRPLGLDFVAAAFRGGRLVFPRDSTSPEFRQKHSRTPRVLFKPITKFLP